MGGTLALAIYAAAWFRTMQPPVKLFLAPDVKDARIVQLDAQIRSAKVEEGPDSLRRRTVRLAAEVSHFWNSRPAPPPAVPNPSTDEERQRNAESAKYWREVESIYAATYRDAILGIIR